MMHFGHSNSLADYHMSSMQLQNFKEDRDLSIVISDDLKWDSTEL